MGSIRCITPLEIPEIKLIELYSNNDYRGINTKLFSKDELIKNEIVFDTKELLLIHSNKNVLRGFHYQKDREQSRIIALLSGKLFISVVALDLNQDKKHSHCEIELYIPNTCVYIPQGYALCTLAVEDTDFLCFCGDNVFDKDSSTGFFWNDTKLGIKWPIPCGNIIVSDSDCRLPKISEADC